MKFKLAVITVLLALFVCPVYAQKDAQVASSDVAPFLGKWAGKWEWTVHGEAQSRDADLVIEMDNNKPVGTLHLASGMLAGHGARNTLPEKTMKINRLKFTKKDGVVLLSFPREDGTRDYVFRLAGDRLDGSATNAGTEKITLKKVK